MPSRRAFLTALSTCGIGTLAGCSGEKRVSSRWPRAGYDDRNTGYAPHVSGPGSTPTVKWTADVPDGQYPSSPVLHDDRVYVGYGTDSVHEGPQKVGLRVLDAGTGETHRDVTVTSGDGESTVGALYRDSVVSADGALYLMAFDGLYSFDPSGEERWHVEFGGRPTNASLRSSHPVVADGTVFAPTASTTSESVGTESLYAVDADTGETVWRYVVSTDDGWTLSPAYADGVVYLAALDFGVVALSAATGDELWRAPLPSVYGPPTVADGTVFVSADPSPAETSHVVALSAETGEERWRSAGSGTWLGRRIAAAHGRLYHRESLNDFVARDAATGEERWRYAEAEDVSLATPAVTDEGVYVGASNPENDESGLLVLDPADGTRLGFGNTDVDARLNASVALADGLAVVTASRGRVYAFETCTLAASGRCLY